MKKLLFSACIAALACGMADAAIVNVTYSGTVLYGYDNTGQFGMVGDLTGASFVTKYLFDTSKGYVGDDGNVAYAYGGSAYGLDSPAISGSIAINGSSPVAIGGDAAAEIYRDREAGFSEQYSYLGAGDSYIYNDVYDYADRPFGGATFNGDVSGLSGSGYFQIANNSAYGGLTATHLTVSSGSVPEPASWAMMVGGFGMLGGAMRRRQRTSVAFG